jgi:hypothetical protein
MLLRSLHSGVIDDLQDTLLFYIEINPNSKHTLTEKLSSSLGSPIVYLLCVREKI